MRHSDIVNVKNKYYYVDSCWTSDCGYKTMVFECDSTGNVKNWLEVYVRRYTNEIKMWEGHIEIVKDLKEGRLLV